MRSSQDGQASFTQKILMRMLSIKWKILLSCLAIVGLSGLRGGLAFFVQVHQAKLVAFTEATHVAHAIAQAATFTQDGAPETSLYRNAQALQAYTMALHTVEQRDIMVV